MAATLAGKVAELNLGQYEPELLKLAVRHAVSPAEAAFYLREIQACTSKTFNYRASIHQIVPWAFTSTVRALRAFYLNPFSVL